MDRIKPIMNDVTREVLEVVAAVATGLVGVVLAFWIFRPRIALGKSVTKTSRPRGDVYNVWYNNKGWTQILDIQVEVWLRSKTADNPVRYTFLPIPVDDPRIPMLARRNRNGQVPLLLLDRVDWTRYGLEEGKQPSSDLQEILTRFNAKLYLAISATSSIGQIRRVIRRDYGPEKIMARRQSH